MFSCTQCTTIEAWSDHFDFILVFVGSLIALVLLGLVAGFSPTLYVAQIAVGSKTKKNLVFTGALMAGVLLAIILLIILFQTFNLSSMIGIIDKAAAAIRVSIVFNLVVGAGLIVGGIHYLRNQKVPKPKPSLFKHAGGTVGIFGLGFFRTFISVTGVTATYIAGNLIADVSTTLIERSLHTLVFLAASIVPFAAIVMIMKKHPEYVASKADHLRGLLHRINYRPIMGIAAVVLGSSIMIFHIMMLLFY